MDRKNVICPRCGSAERTRLLLFYLREKTNFFNENHKVLFVAPDYSQQKMFKKLNNIDYLSIDIESPLAMIKMDITDMHFENDTFDIVICSHVLEHINNDQKAINEIYRVLKLGGWAIIQVPLDVNRGSTYEDSNIILPEERQRLFGNYDHVRIYGMDYKNRLERSGFHVKADNYVKKLGNKFIQKYRLDKNEDIYFCTKEVDKH